MRSIYNRFGFPEIYILEDGRFINSNGQNLGFLSNSSVYNYRGRHVGWFENGVLRDNNGNVSGFSDNPTDYPFPILPFRMNQFPPHHIPQAPTRPIVDIPYLPPLKTVQWSFYTPASLFSSI